MATQFACPSCGKLVQTSDAQTSEYVQCPFCDTAFALPQVQQPRFIEFSCSSCGASFRVPAGLAGKQTSCLSCGASLPVPSGSSPSAVPPTPTPPAVPPAIPPVWPTRGVGAVSPPSPTPAQSTALHWPGGPGKEQPPQFTPAKKQGGNPAFVVLIACGVLVVLILIAAIYKFSQPEQKKVYNLPVSVTITGTDDLVVKNAGSQVCTNLLIEISAGGAVYSFASSAPLGPGGSVTVNLAQFTAPGRPKLDIYKTPPQQITISALLPGGEKATIASPWFTTRAVDATPERSGSTPSAPARP